MKSQRSLAELLQNHLETEPFLLEVIHSGYGNIMAIAESLSPVLAAHLETPPSTAAVGMALRRYVEKQSPPKTSAKKFPAHIDITTRTKIYEVAIPRTDHNKEVAEKLRRIGGKEPGDLLSIAEGMYEIVVFASVRLKGQIRQILKGRKKNTEQDDLACVTVNWPPETKSIPGIYYRVTRALALRQISIQSFHTIGAEMMILVKEEDLQKAEDSLQQLLNGLSR